MTGIEAEDDGMVCGGIVELFVEPIKWYDEIEVFYFFKRDWLLINWHA
jgi:xanthine/CO dehydrogenase XdhC/CoxF family maturation factor